LDGTFDKYVDLPSESSFVAYRAYTRLLKALPNELFSEITRHMGRDTSMRAIQASAKLLRRKYGLDPIAAGATLMDYIKS